MKNKSIHFLILGVLMIYVFSADAIYARFFVKNGKPIAQNIALPAQSKGSIKFDFGYLDEVRYDGQDFYSLHGYALHPSLSPKNYNIKIVLHSVSQDLIYRADPIASPDLIQTLPNYIPSMMRAEYRVMLAKQALKIDNYQIGILLEDLQGKPLMYEFTGSFIERSPNKLRLVVDKQGE